MVPVAFFRLLVYNERSGFKEHHYEKLCDQSSHLHGICDGGSVFLFAGVASGERHAEI